MGIAGYWAGLEWRGIHVRPHEQVSMGFWSWGSLGGPVLGYSTVIVPIMSMVTCGSQM